MKGSQVASPGYCILVLEASEHTELRVSCAEHRRVQAADTETSPLPSPPVPTESLQQDSQRLSLPKESRQNIHRQALEVTRKFFFGTSRIPEYLV